MKCWNKSRTTGLELRNASVPWPRRSMGNCLREVRRQLWRRTFSRPDIGGLDRRPRTARFAHGRRIANGRYGGQRARPESYDHGLDPRLVFTAPRPGQYIVRLFAFPSVATGSISFAGGDKFVYRLTLTRDRFLDYVYPLAAKAGAVRCGTLRLEHSRRGRTNKHSAPWRLATCGRFSIPQFGAATVAAVPHAAVVEIEPNDAQPQSRRSPTLDQRTHSISGRGRRCLCVFRQEGSEAVVTGSCCAGSGSRSIRH